MFGSFIKSDPIFWSIRLRVTNQLISSSGFMARAWAVITGSQSVGSCIYTGEIPKPKCWAAFSYISQFLQKGIFQASAWGRVQELIETWLPAFQERYLTLHCCFCTQGTTESPGYLKWENVPERSNSLHSEFPNASMPQPYCGSSQESGFFLTSTALP
jgi:hypothetical protein